MRSMGAVPRLIAAGVSLLVWSCAQAPPDVEQLFERYAAASASHDLETLEALTADDVVWRLGPYTFEGKEAALGPNAYDAGVENTLIYRDVTVRGNFVEAEVAERNEVVEAIGMTEVRSYPRFTFRNGILARKEPSGKQAPAEYSMAEFNRRLTPLRQWIRETHPEAIAELTTGDGTFVFNRANGALMLRMAREWVAAGAPGRLQTP